MSERKTSALWLLMPLLVGFLTPSSIIVVMDIALGGVALPQAIRGVAGRQFAEGENLFFLASLGLLPFVLLVAVLIAPFRSALHRHRVPLLSMAGVAGALAFMIPAHVSVWLPLYTNERMSSTAAIAFVFIPFVSCVTMAVGLLVGTFATRRAATA